VHSLGAIDSPPVELAWLDDNGKTLASTTIPQLKAPTDLLPKRVTITMTAPPGRNLVGSSLMIDPERKVKEITRLNNSVTVR
jgi:hypothetical protein